MESEFGVRVAVENDADAAALAEASWGTAKRAGRFIYITVSTGIGSSVVLDGELYRGVDGAHPELGHQVIDASGPAMLLHRARMFGEPRQWSVNDGFRVDIQRPDGDQLTAEQICALAKQGEALALRAVERQGYYLGLGLANLVTLFIPGVIALGGGVMKSADLFLDPRPRCDPPNLHASASRKNRAALASLGTDTCLIGAGRAFSAPLP